MCLRSHCASSPHQYCAYLPLLAPFMENTEKKKKTKHKNKQTTPRPPPPPPPNCVSNPQWDESSLQLSYGTVMAFVKNAAMSS